MKKTTKLPGMLFLMMAACTPAMAQNSTTAQSLALKANQMTAGQKVVFKGISVTNTDWINWGNVSSAQLTDNSVFIVENATSGNGIILKRESDNKYVGGSEQTISMVNDAASATVFSVSTPALDGTQVSGTHEVTLPSWATNDDGYQIRFTNSENNFLNIQAANAAPKYANGKGSWSIAMAYNANQPVSSISVKCVDENGNTIKSDFDLTVTGSSYTLSAPAISGYTYSGTADVNDTPSQGTTTTVSGNTTVTYHYETLPPFELSTLSADGTSFEKAVWYRVGIHSTEANRRYWVYDATNSKLDITTKDNFDMYADNQLFCFVGTGTHDIKIFNKAAGTSVWATYDGTNNQVSMTDNTDVPSTTWSMVASTAVAGNFCFKTNVADVTNCYINNYNTEAIKLSGAAGPGSTCYFSKFDFDTELANYKAALDSKLATAQNIVGFVDGPISLETWQTSIDVFKANPSKETYNAVQTALSQVLNIEPGLYYRVINADYATRETPHYLSFTADGNGQLQPVEGESTTAFNDPQTLFQLVQNENNSYSMKLQGELIGNTQTQSKPVYLTAHGTDEGTYSAGTYTLEKKATGCYLLRCTNPVNTGDGGNKVCITMLEAGGAYTVSTWGDGVKYSQWYLQPTNEFALNITDAGYATAKYPFAVQVPEGVTAYTGKATAENGVFTLNKIENGIIPANTPVVLEGAAATHTMTILASNTTPAIEDNDLSGTLLSASIPAGTNAYILGEGTQGTGFYQMSDNDRTLGANKAYLELPAEVSNVRSIIFSDGQTTGIESTVAEGAEAEEYYDLQGRRVMKPIKGIYVTKSGKKVLINK